VIQQQCIIMYYLNFPIELHSRRGLKATFLLVPLFGIQLFFITYRPTEQKEHRLLYEIICDNKIIEMFYQNLRCRETTRQTTPIVPRRTTQFSPHKGDNL
jgi:hypothetical protein